MEWRRERSFWRDGFRGGMVEIRRDRGRVVAFLLRDGRMPMLHLDGRMQMLLSTTTLSV